MCTQEGFGLCVCSTHQAVQRQAAQDWYDNPKTLCGIQPFIQSSFTYYTWHLWFASSVVLSFKPEEIKKKKKKGNGHMSAKSSPFYRNFLKALLIAIMCVISQCSDSSNHKGSISCKIFIWACCNPEQPVAFQIRGKEEWTLHRLTSVFYTIPWAWDTSSS